MGRSVLADADRVVAEDEDTRNLHQGRHAHGVAQIVGKHQKGRPGSNNAPVHGHAVHDRAHGMFTNTIVDVAAATIITGERFQLALVLCCGFQVRCTADQFGNGIGKRRQHFAGRANTGLRLTFFQKSALHLEHRLFPTLRQFALHQPVELRPIVRSQHVKTLLPGPALGRAAQARLLPGSAQVIGNDKRRMRPMKKFARRVGIVA